MRYIVPCTRLQASLLTRVVPCAELSNGSYETAPVTTDRQIFPYTNSFQLRSCVVDCETVIASLEPFLTERRRNTILKVVNQRTFNVLPVIDGLINTGNVAAVMRTADGMGCGALHCIESKSSFRKASERCSAGAEKWLHVKTWSTPEACLQSLESVGYRIVATDVTDDAIPLHEVDWTVPTAVVFGNEGVGVSPSVRERSHQRVVIPMAGFVESFNISVAAAIVLYEARRQRFKHLGVHSELTPEERRVLQAAYYIRHKENAWEVVSSLSQRDSR